MKVQFSTRVLSLLAFALLAAPLQSWAQCAMCAATVESNQKAGQGGIGTSLNTGILYLMILPYIMFSIIAYFWYKNAKRQKTEAQKRAQARARVKAAQVALN